MKESSMKHPCPSCNSDNVFYDMTISSRYFRCEKCRHEWTVEQPQTVAKKRKKPRTELKIVYRVIVDPESDPSDHMFFESEEAAVEHIRGIDLDDEDERLLSVDKLYLLKAR